MASPRGIVQWLDQMWHREGVLPRKGKLLVAVSGGADSVALLRLLAEIGRSDYWNWELVVGHVEHGIRGRASVADARFVKELAGQRGLPFVMRKLKLGEGVSEGVAREKRLKSLAAMAEKVGAMRVILGHQLEDHAETVLMKLFRGCGMEGLMGIRSSVQVEGVLLTRPLIRVRRAALREYLTDIGQAWREDATNAKPVYTRNRVRAEILPRVEELWPGAVEAIGRMSDVVEDAWQPVHDMSYAMDQVACLKVDVRQAVYERDKLRTWPVILAEVLRRQVERLGGTREIAGWERIREAVRLIQGMEGGKAVQMGRGIVVRVGKTVIIERQRRRGLSRRKAR